MLDRFQPQQGPETDPAEVARLRAGMAAGIDTNVYLKNYRKDGSSFFNHVFVCCLKVCLYESEIPDNVPASLIGRTRQSLYDSPWCITVASFKFKIATTSHLLHYLV